MSLNVIFITAGEWPSQNGLLVSQVLETARALQAKGYTVSWLAVIPLLSRVKRFVLRVRDLTWLQAECECAGILFYNQIIPVTLGSPWSMLMRRWWHKRVARRAVRQLLSAGCLGGPIILHARSYDAAEIGLLLRQLICTRDSNHPVVASFDMRSLLGPEVPMAHGVAGTAAYGFIKEQEYALVRDSDITFAPINIARRQYVEETGLTIHYAAIQGLDRDSDRQVNFSARWLRPRIGYSGSLGQWNDPQLLLRMFGLFPGWEPRLACIPIDDFAGMDCKLYKQSELSAYYDSLIALVIPGLPTIEGYFRTLKMRCNFFSTKAAEALSMGVPLVVSSELAELAEFVREHDCGLVVDLRDGIPHLPAGVEISSRAMWERFTSNAERVGALFERHAVISVYERAWQAAIDRRRGANPTVAANVQQG